MSSRSSRSRRIARADARRANPAPSPSSELQARALRRHAARPLRDAASVSSITLDDVKSFYETFYRPERRDPRVQRRRDRREGPGAGGEAARGLADRPASCRRSTYDAADPPRRSARIILVDRPTAKQSVVRMGIPRVRRSAATKSSPARVAGQILTSGHRLAARPLRPRREGLAYGVHGVFQPGRQAGDLRRRHRHRLRIHRRRRRGDLQGVRRHAAAHRHRTTSWPRPRPRRRRHGHGHADDRPAGRRTASTASSTVTRSTTTTSTPQRIAQVTPSRSSEVMNKYVRDGEMVIVVVAPAAR